MSIISADRIRFNLGGTAWLVFPADEHNDAAAQWDQLDRVCDTCKGRCAVGGLTWQANDIALPCPDCLNGRHTFELEVECVGQLQENGRGGLTCDGGCGNTYPWGTLSFTVSVVPGMIAAIEPVGGPSAHPFITRHSSINRWVLHHIPKAQAIREPINLPPDAAPGWTVLLNTQPEKTP